MKYINIKYFYTIVLFVLSAGVSFAAPPCPECPPDPDDLPINGNLVILLIISLVYGSYKIYKHIQYKKASI